MMIIAEGIKKASFVFLIFVFSFTLPVQGEAVVDEEEIVQQVVIDESIITGLNEIVAKEPQFIVSLYRMIGDFYSRNNQVEKAVTCFKKILSISPGDSVLINRMIDLYLRVKNTDGAIAALKKSISLQPEDPHLRRILAGIYVRAQRFEDAEAEYKKIIETATDRVVIEEINRELFNLYKSTNRLDEAIKEMEEEGGKAKTPVDKKGYYRSLVSAYQIKGDKEKVKFSYEKIVEIEPDNREALNSLIELYVQANETEKSIVVLKKLIELSPQEMYNYERLANTYIKAIKPKEAIAVWKKAIAASPSDVSLRSRFGETLFRLKRYDEAIEEFKMASKLASQMTSQLDPAMASEVNPDYLRYQQKIGEILIETKKLSEAKVVFKDILSQTKEEWQKENILKRLNEIELLLQAEKK